jgi:ribosome maturation factor RimP
MESELKNYIEECLETTDFKLIDFVLRGEKNTKVLEIYLDRKDAFTIAELARINRELWKRVEDNEFANGLSKIVVSSPGADKPFKYIWQLNKHIGRTLELKLNNEESIKGVLKEVIEENNPRIILDIKVDEKKAALKEELKTLSFNEIKESKVVFLFKNKK